MNILKIDYFGGLYLMIEKDFDKILFKKNFLDKLVKYKDIVLEKKEIFEKDNVIRYDLLMIFNDIYIKIMVKEINQYYEVYFKKTFIKNNNKLLEHSFNDVPSRSIFGKNKNKKYYKIYNDYNFTNFNKIIQIFNKNEKINYYYYKTQDNFKISLKVYKSNIFKGELKSYIRVYINKKIKNIHVSLDILLKEIDFLKRYEIKDFINDLVELTEEDQEKIRIYVLKNYKKNPELFINN